MSDESIRLAAPFEHLAWDGDNWTGPVMLPGWASFQTRLGPYASLSSDEPADGTAELVVGVPDTGDDEPKPTSPAQARAFRHLVENEPAVTRAVQEAILAEYPRIRARYGYGPGKGAETMPDVRSIRDLQPLIGLSLVHILEDERNGIAYVGFELGCSWDAEHGLGVITHAGRVLEVGEADCSFQAPDPTPSRKWWEFWK